MGTRGPKPKPKEEKSVTQTYRCSRELADRIKKHIPKRERSGIILGCLRREVEERELLALMGEITDADLDAACQRLPREHPQEGGGDA